MRKVVEIDCDGREDKASHLDSFHYEINSEIAKGSFAFFVVVVVVVVVGGGGGHVCSTSYNK